MIALHILAALAGEIPLVFDPTTTPLEPLRHCGACGFNSGDAFIHTLPAETQPQGSFGLGLRLDWQEFDSFSDAELLNFANQGVETHSIDRSFVLRAGAVYALSDDWNVGVDLPYSHNMGLHESSDVGGVPDVEDNGDQAGVGDASLFMQWCFLRKASAQTYASLYLGSKLPTGDTGLEAGDGSRLEPDHQPGSGSFDPFLGVALGKSFGMTTLGASALYTFAGDGSQDSNLGDVLRLNLGIGYSPMKSQEDSPQWRWLFELNAQWHERMRIDGAVDGNSGGEQLFAAPGLRLTWPSGISWFASVGVPLAQELHGEQSKTRFRASTGLGFAL